jgi:hypothetical protein
MADPRWTRSRLLELLKDLEARHGFAGTNSLDAASQEAGTDLRRRIRKEFGSLGNAKKLAGVKTWPLWTRERIVAGLKRRAKAGIIHYRELRREDCALAAAIERIFHSFPAACEAARVPANHEPKNSPWKWTRENIAAVLEDAWKRRDIRVSSLRKEYPGIYKGALREFKTWQAALRHAGVPKYAYAGRMSSWHAFLAEGSSIR